MAIKRIIIIGAGCPLADTIAEKLSKHSEIIGISKREFKNEFYNQKSIFGFIK